MLHISFDLDEENRKISNVKIRAVEVFDVRLDKNKLIFSKAALSKIGASYGDRVCIGYVDDKPVIGMADKFDNGDEGVLVNRSCTAAYKGSQNKLLSNYGSEFVLTPYRDGLFYMNNIVDTELEKDEEASDNAMSLEEEIDSLTAGFPEFV